MFNFSSLQKKGIIALIIVLLLMFATRQILSHILRPLSDTDMVNMDTAFKRGSTDVICNINTDSLRTNRTYAQQHIRADFAQTASTRKIFTVDANIADTLDLQEIRGIGSVLAKRIVNYRNLLGGFVAKEQLLEVWGIDSIKYTAVKDAFVLKTVKIAKIKLNTIDIQTLKKHPYMDYYLAKAIVQDREKNGLFEKIEDILRIEMIDNQTFAKIKPYLSIE
ncbi:MAG: helix-hairpin-helix domain-containing protein [Bacteroidales bacterium]|jgi:DNA uptake protein ComE-like DNA-binding protein|nr:helix-hairpin-helix domain-containing protein [Bacteroidales bacterium]